MVENRIRASSSQLTIIGAGPIGLEAAAMAAEHDLDFVVLEKGNVGDHIRGWGHVQLFTPFHMNHSELGLALLQEDDPDYRPPDGNGYLTGDQFVESYLEPLAASSRLAGRVLTRHRVEAIARDRISKRDLPGHPGRSRHRFRLLIRTPTDQRLHHSRAIIDAGGVYSTPRSLGNGGIPAVGESEALNALPERIHMGVTDLESMARELRGQSILLVGSGQSAATQLVQLDRLAPALDLKVTWLWRNSSRQPYSRIPEDPLPARDSQSQLGNRLAQRPPEWLTCLPGSTVEAIRIQDDGRLGLVLQTDDGTLEKTVDRILGCVGFEPDATLYRQLQVHECYATQGPMKLSAALLGASADCLQQETQGIDTLRNPEPRFFIIGNKSYGTGSNFLLSNGIDQVATVMKELAGTLRETSAAQ